MKDLLQKIQEKEKDGQIFSYLVDVFRLCLKVEKNLQPGKDLDTFLEWQEQTLPKLLANVGQVLRDTRPAPWAGGAKT